MGNEGGKDASNAKSQAVDARPTYTVYVLGQ